MRSALAVTEARSEAADHWVLRPTHHRWANSQALGSLAEAGTARVPKADRLPVVDLAAVAHAKDEDDELVVVNVVDDPVVAGTDPPLARATDEPGRGWWPGIDSEQLNGGLEASPHIRIELAELARG